MKTVEMVIIGIIAASIVLAVILMMVKEKYDILFWEKVPLSDVISFIDNVIERTSDLSQIEIMITDNVSANYFFINNNYLMSVLAAMKSFNATKSDINAVQQMDAFNHIKNFSIDLDIRNAVNRNNLDLNVMLMQTISQFLLGIYMVLNSNPELVPELLKTNTYLQFASLYPACNQVFSQIKV